ncbi:AAA family ATPase [Plantibacter sp. CFBP 8798]|uniref:McrB family protein n=1 Tax=Plantibacter sp. CFBP 8798 TaxID=2775268 RepID=UPI00177C1DCA|nr:AAA family ATPase [Plantibacter sp. CFBP 8798]MBD8467061.1 AAA family ATPase [Plantibacter sp. CFBP 8798]
MTLSLASEVANVADYLPASPAAASPAGPPAAAVAPVAAEVAGDDTRSVLEYVERRGFHFAPWQVASYITAIRTKPFVILAGVSGTGKSALPRLVAEATGAIATTVPVRPDWNDSSELLGYKSLTGDFEPGHLLRFAREAKANPDMQYFFLLDEMNIARPEYYFAEVLSRIEETGVLLDPAGATPLKPEAGAEWGSIAMPANLAVVGSVNMDETTFGFSRKVLDRAFVIEFSEVDLSLIGQGELAARPRAWHSDAWRRESATLFHHPRSTEPSVIRVVETLSELNAVLKLAQLHFGYRVRDEVAMFVLAAERSPDQFESAEGGQIDPLDLAISMKVLPRIQGSGVVISNLLRQLAEWAQPSDGAGSAFPVCAQRIDLMQRRLVETGFTNYWT